jgi:hypothetical protein
VVPHFDYQCKSLLRLKGSHWHSMITSALLEVYLSCCRFSALVYVCIRVYLIVVVILLNLTLSINKIKLKKKKLLN